MLVDKVSAAPEARQQILERTGKASLLDWKKCFPNTDVSTSLETP